MERRIKGVILQKYPSFCVEAEASMSAEASVEAEASKCEGDTFHGLRPDRRTRRKESKAVVNATLKLQRKYKQYVPRCKHCVTNVLPMVQVCDIKSMLRSLAPWSQRGKASVHKVVLL